MYVYLELLKALVLVGILVKSLPARAWLATVTAAGVMYAAIGLAAIGLFHRTWPVMTSIVGKTPSGAALSAVLAVEIVASLVVWQLGARANAKGTPRREVAELFALAAIISGVELALAVSV